MAHAQYSKIGPNTYRKKICNGPIFQDSKSVHLRLGSTLFYDIGKQFAAGAALGRSRARSYSIEDNVVSSFFTTGYAEASLTI
jgi:hypothetical protein